MDLQSKQVDMKLSKDVYQAKMRCKNVGIKDEYQDCCVVNFKSHPK